MIRIPHRPLPNPGLDILLRRHLQHLLNIPRAPNLGPADLNPLLNQRKHIEPGIAPSGAPTRTNRLLVRSS